MDREFGFDIQDRELVQVLLNYQEGANTESLSLLLSALKLISATIELVRISVKRERARSTE